MKTCFNYKIPKALLFQELIFIPKVLLLVQTSSCSHKNPQLFIYLAIY